jgi:peroxiredoxin
VCNREAPSVEEATKRWAGQVEFVGVAWFGDDDAFQGFIDKHGLTFPQVSDDSGDVYSRFGVAAQPAMAIVSPSGEVEQIFGAVDDGTLDAILSDALD